MSEPINVLAVNYNEDLLQALPEEELNKDEKMFIKQLMDVSDGVFKYSDGNLIANIVNNKNEFNSANIRHDFIIDNLNKLIELPEGEQIKNVQMDNLDLTAYLSQFSRENPKDEIAEAMNKIVEDQKKNNQDRSIGKDELNQEEVDQDNIVEDLVHAGANGLVNLAKAPFSVLGKASESLSSWRDGQPEESIALAKKAGKRFEEAINEFRSNKLVAEAINDAEQTGDSTKLAELIQKNPSINNLWKIANSELGTMASLWRRASRANARAGLDVRDQMEESMDKAKNLSRHVPSKFKLNGEVKQTMSQRIAELSDKISRLVERIISKFSQKKKASLV